MNNKIVIDRWYAAVYDQNEIQQDDVDFLIEVIGKEPKRILEVACGSGRILVPLSKAGHEVVGIDINEEMLSRIESKAIGISNLKYYNKNAILDNWGDNFDVCVLAGNLLINIVSDLDYKEAQKLLIKKAYDSLKHGGYIYLDFNLFANPKYAYTNPNERVIFEGTDEDGVKGKYSILTSFYNEETHLLTGESLTQLITLNKDVIEDKKTYSKYIPTYQEIHSWLAEIGFKVEKEFGDYSGNKIGETTYRAIIYAKK